MNGGSKWIYVLILLMAALFASVVLYFGPILLVEVDLLRPVRLHLGPNLLVSVDMLRPVQRETELNQARTSIVSFIAVTAAVIGVLFTARTFQANRENHRRDRYYKAVGNLSSDKEFIRVAAINDLGSLSRTTYSLRPEILLLLSQFVRETFPTTRSYKESLITGDEERETATLPKPSLSAALRVITQRDPHPDNEAIDLSNTDLRFVSLRGADLTGVWLEKADLHKADLCGAKLRDANCTLAVLSVTNMRGANLEQCDLTSANLYNADLMGVYGAAQFEDADLKKADLTSADLRNSRFRRAHMRYTKFDKADLRGALFGKEPDVREASFYKATLTTDQFEGWAGDSESSRLPEVYGLEDANWVDPKK